MELVEISLKTALIALPILPALPAEMVMTSREASARGQTILDLTSSSYWQQLEEA